MTNQLRGPAGSFHDAANQLDAGSPMTMTSPLRPTSPLRRSGGSFHDTAYQFDSSSPMTMTSPFRLPTSSHSSATTLQPDGLHNGSGIPSHPLVAPAPTPALSSHPSTPYRSTASLWDSGLGSRIGSHEALLKSD